MNINKVNTPPPAYTQEVKAREAAAQAAKSAQAKGAETVASQTVVMQSLSSSGLGGVSQNSRLEKLAEQIKNKTFKVDPEAIADKMLSDKETIANLLNS